MKLEIDFFSASALGEEKNAQLSEFHTANALELFDNR